MVVIDAVVQLLPGCWGTGVSRSRTVFGGTRAGSAAAGLPLRKPREWMGRAVPEVLLSGIADQAWRLAQIGTDAGRRPDYWGQGEGGFGRGRG